jgi:hypothetical protein
VTAPEKDRREVWLPLLRRLTEVSSDWTVWKNIDSAFTGGGDVDSIGPGEDWPAIEHEFATWAKSNGLGPVISCPHAPFLVHLVALDQSAPAETFFELDVNRRKVFLGSTLFLPADLRPLARVNDEGFRRLRPGAEGLLKLVHNGTKRRGRQNEEGLKTKRIPELLAEDWEGVEQAALLFKSGRSAVLDSARAVVEGGWDRSAAVRVEAWCLARALKEPDAVAARLRFRVNKKRCPVLRAVFESKRYVGPDPAPWLEEVAETHEILW